MRLTTIKSTLSVAIILVACSSMTPQEKENQETALRGRELNEEIAVGREMAAKILGAFGQVKDEKSMEYLNLLGGALAKKVGRPEINYRFAILDSDEINALAAPAGFIFVTKGLLKRVESESELAGVLAHEIAHINEKHMYREVAPKRDVSAGETLSRMLSRGNSEFGAGLLQMVQKGMKILLEDGLGLEKEKEADSAGALYVAEMGYPANALHTFLKRVSSDSMDKVAKSNTLTGDRVAALESFLTENGLGSKSRVNQKVLGTRFRRSLASIKTESKSN